MIEDDATRASWRSVSQAHEKLTVSFRTLLAAKTIEAEHEAKRGLLGSLIGLGFSVRTVAIDLMDVDLSYGGDALPVEWYLPDIIDIESEEDPPCPTS